MTTIETALFFFVILFFSWFFMHRQIIPVRYPLFVLLLFLSAGTIRTISEMISSELIVYNSAISDAVAVRTGKILNLLSDTALVPPEVIKHCATTGLKLKQIKINKETLFVTAGEKKILISSSLKNNLIQKSEPDYIILTGSYPKAESHIRLTRPLNSLIMTSSDVFSSSRLQGVLKDNNIDSVHYVKKSGAFRTRL
jgi:hypothetical protein